MNFSYLRREPGFYRRVFTLALPVVLQNLITTSLGFMDTFMVGLVGQEQMSAVTVANVPIYIIQLIVFGLQSGSPVLISQFWGRGDRESINRVMGIGFFVAGGISTLEEKSLGCTQKAGTSAVRDVMLYGEQLKTKGLNLLSAPGNDLVASTALASSGCHLVLFTTGRGTPFGTFVPTVKVSTNSNLNARKPNWIDFNAGSLLEGKSMEELCECFIQFIIGIASGNPTNNEKNGYREIAIFKSGVTL